MKNIIFDLDLTLVDSTIAEEARSNRNWPLVYSMIPHFTLYPGMETVFQHIRSSGIKVAIVSTAPSAYLQRVVNHFNIPADVIIGYHDAARKPSPAGMFLAIQRMDTSPSNVISFGDRAIDIQASRAAGVQSVACYWGTKEAAALTGSAPDLRIMSPKDIIGLL